jgi:hypothetical protein
MKPNKQTNKQTKTTTTTTTTTTGSIPTSVSTSAARRDRQSPRRSAPMSGDRRCRAATRDGVGGARRQAHGAREADLRPHVQLNCVFYKKRQQQRFLGSSTSPFIFKIDTTYHILLLLLLLRSIQNIYNENIHMYVYLLGINTFYIF